MKNHSPTWRTSLLAALWLLALAAIASADAQKRSCPLQGLQCSSEQGEHDQCTFDVLRVAALPVQTQDLSPSGFARLRPSLSAKSPAVKGLQPAPAGAARAYPAVDALTVAPKTSPPLSS